MGKVKEKLIKEDIVYGDVGLDEDIYSKIAEELFKPNPEFDKARTEATLELLAILTQAIHDNPTMRFGQVLQNYGFVKQARPVKPEDAGRLGIHWQNEFYDEPQVTLKRVKDRLNAIKNTEG